MQAFIVALKPAKLAATVAAAERLEADRKTSLTQWRLGVERASYEASRAERRYRAVDPENRLVARGLEREWEERLTKTTAAEILANPATRRRQVTMTISLNPLRLVRMSGGGFRGSRIVRHYKPLEWPITVCGSNIAGLSAVCGRTRTKISGRKIPFPKMVFALGSSRPTAGGQRRLSPWTLGRKAAHKWARLPGAGRGAMGSIHWPLEQKPPSNGGAFITPATASRVQAFAIGRATPAEDQ